MWKQFFLKKNLRVRWLFSFFVPLYLLLFFIFLEPLKGDIVSYNYPFAYNIVAFMAISAIHIICCILMPYFFSPYFKSETWTLSRFFCWFFSFCFLIIAFSYSFDVRVHHVENASRWTALYFKGYMPPVAIFLALTILGFFFVYNPKIESESLLPVAHNQDSEPFPMAILPHDILPLPIQLVTICDASGKNMLELHLENLYYITSSNNYIEVFYKKQKSAALTHAAINRMLVRSSLKTIEEQYAHLSELYRCHKTFMVNAQKVVAIKGNSKGYTLVLQDIEVEIPVSRQKNSELETRFSHII